MKKIISVLLLVALLVTCWGCNGQVTETTQPETTAPTVETTPDPFAEVNELEPVNGVYQIVSVKGLQNIQAHPDGSFELLCDIDLGGISFTPIGTKEAPFTGQLNGKNFTISNFKLDTPNGDGDLGFFGVNKGLVQYLKLADVTVSVNENTQRAGGLAAENAGELERVSVAGTLSGKTKEQAAIGGMAGENSGTIRNECLAAVDILWDTAADVGGLVGRDNGGLISYSEAAGRLEITGSANAGLLCGKATDTNLEYCRFTGGKNTREGELFTNFTGAQENAAIKDCLWRDNTNSSENLPQSALALRQEAVDYMAAMGSVVWTVNENFVYQCSDSNTYCDQMFLPGQTFKGLPYTHKHGSLERMEYCLNEDGSVKDWLKPIGYDGFDMYMGNDCSGAVYWAWARVGNSFTFQWTWGMLPSAGMGVLPVGDYDAYLSTGADIEESIPVVEATGAEKMYEAYAKLRLGDAVVAYFASGNHARLCSMDPVVLRDENGNIDPAASYVITHEQGTTGKDPKYISTWLLDARYSFKELYEHYYLPVTIKELQEGISPAGEAKMEGAGEGKLGLTDGTIMTNYRINSVTMELSDAQGENLWAHTMFAGVDEFDSYGSDLVMRSTITQFEMRDFAPLLRELSLESGETYQCKISVLLSNGDHITVSEFSFQH